MSIIVARPPNFEAILAAFPDADKPGVIFAFGDDIYNPSGGEIPRALKTHEAVHQSAQRQMTPEKWWERYIADHDFRYQEELRAHVAEYIAQLQMAPDRNYRAKLLQSTAQRLVAALYNYSPPRSLSTAMRDIRRELER